MLRGLLLTSPEYDATPRQVVRGEFYSYLVPGQDTDVVHTHLAGDVSQDHMPVFELDPESCIRQVLYDLALHLNYVVFCHTEFSSDLLKAFRAGLAKQGLVLMRHHVCLHLRHKVHRDNHDDEK